MRIELTNDTAQATITTAGGLVEQYSVDGRDVLLPRQKIDGKLRGGSHVCAPYFGPGTRPDQPQHGYGRDVEWTVKEQAPGRVVLSHVQAEGDYAGLALELTYALEDDALVMDLAAHNTAAQPLRLTPGFHPYFACPDAERARIQGETHEAVALAATVLRSAPGGTVEADFTGQTVYVTTDSLREFALWTSHPKLFVCIEPTLAGNSFSEQPEGSAAEYVAAGHRARYGCQIAAP